MPVPCSKYLFLAELRKLESVCSKRYFFCLRFLTLNSDRSEVSKRPCKNILSGTAEAHAHSVESLSPLSVGAGAVVGSRGGIIHCRQLRRTNTRRLQPNLPCRSRLTRTTSPWINRGWLYLQSPLTMLLQELMLPSASCSCSSSRGRYSGKE